MGLSYPAKARTTHSTSDLDVEANIPQPKNASDQEEINRGEEAGRRIIIWAPILCISFLVLLCVSVWGLHEIASEVKGNK